MEKIKMTTPLVEMDGDEMAAILWKETREKLVLPFVVLLVDYYDLSIRNRDLRMIRSPWIPPMPPTNTALLSNARPSRQTWSVSRNIS